MKNKAYIFTILAVFWPFLNLNADPLITLFMVPYPITHGSAEAQKALNTLKKPGKISKIGLKSALNSSLISGIFSTYAGQLAMSNREGITNFIRKHPEPNLFIIVTKKITPAMMAGNTIHHWNVENMHDAKMYKMERIHNELDNLTYWVTEEVPLKETGRIPKASITILADPKNVYVPEGITLSEESPNLILPPIYIKKGLAINSNALYLLNLRQFFGSLHNVYKKQPGRTMIITEG